MKYELDLKEMISLGIMSSNAPIIVPGMRNIFQGWLAQEMQQLAAAGYQSLGQRGLAVPRQDSYRLELVSDLDYLVETIFDPNHTVAVAHKQDHKEILLSINSRRGKTASVQESAPDVFELRSPSVDIYDDLIGVNLGTRIYRSRDGMLCVLEDETLVKAKELLHVDQTRRAVGLLRESGISEEAVRELVHDVLAPTSSFAIGVFKNRRSGVGRTNGYAVISGSRALYWLERGGPARIRVDYTNKDVVCAKCRAIMQSLTD